MRRLIRGVRGGRVLAEGGITAVLTLPAGVLGGRLCVCVCVCVCIHDIVCQTIESLT